MSDYNLPASGGAGQQKLFEPARPLPIAANSDPISSHLAAVEVTESGLRVRQKAALLEVVRGQAGPLTSAELARAGAMDRHVVARRLPDLERDGLVERRPMRECTVTGRQAITWIALGVS
jgi:MarR family